MVLLKNKSLGQGVALFTFFKRERITYLQLLEWLKSKENLKMPIAGEAAE